MKYYKIIGMAVKNGELIKRERTVYVDSEEEAFWEYDETVENSLEKKHDVMFNLYQFGKEHECALISKACKDGSVVSGWDIRAARFWTERTAKQGGGV